MLKAKRLTAQQTLKVVRAFCEAYGPEVIRSAYQWDLADVTTVKFDLAYAFSEGADLVGWGGILLNVKDASDEEAGLTVGVFPQHQRRGYRVQILEVLVERAARLGASRASMIIYKSNAAHFNRTMRECHTEGALWKHAGDVWYPEPGYGIFVRVLEEPKAA